MEMKDVAIFIVYLFYIFLACVFHGHFFCCTLMFLLLLFGLCFVFFYPSGSWRMYDLDSAYLLVILAGFHFPVWLSNILTSCSGTSGGRSWAVLSWYIFCISCLRFSSSWILSVLENLGSRQILKLPFFYVSMQDSKPSL